MCIRALGKFVAVVLVLTFGAPIPWPGGLNRLMPNTAHALSTGTGLRGAYYDNVDLTALKLTRTDPLINFDWGYGSPDAGIGGDTFSIRWTGQIEPRYSQTYTFYATPDNGFRLWVNNQQLINVWSDTYGTTYTGTIALTAGQRYDIKIEYYENGGHANLKLEWSSASQAREIIPQSQLYPAASGPLYRDTVLADRPLAYWRLGETSGTTAADTSGNGHTGAIQPGVTLGASGALTTDPNQAMMFNGSTGYIDGSTAIDVPPDFSIELWMKGANTTQDAEVVAVAGSGSATRALHVGNGEIRAIHSVGSDWPTYSTRWWPANAADLTGWLHVVYTVTAGDTGQLYVNGTLVKTQTYSGGLYKGPFTGQWRIGWSDATWLNKYAGTIDEVALYPYALGATRVKAHYDAGRSSTPPNCATSLQQQVNNAASGAVIRVPACLYREKVTINKSLTLVADPGAEIRGSDLWTSWTQSGSLWVSSQSVPSFATHGDCRSGTDRCLKAEQVFFDGQPLRQVSANPTPGHFALNSYRQIVLADHPGGHTVEVTTRNAWIVGGADAVTIQGFRMRHAANDAQHGAITPNGYSSWTIQDNVLSDAHGAVVSLANGNNNKLLRNDIFHGGQLGVHAGGNGNLVQSNTIHDNNTEDFEPGWEAGGLKMAQALNLTLDANEAYNNDGPGLWCDIDCKTVTFSNNRVHHNQGAGIFFEISDGAKIFGNKVWENGWDHTGWGWGAGILISSSRNAEVYNNIVAWNGDGISVISQVRADIDPSDGNSSDDPPDMSHRWNNVIGNYVHDNKIMQEEGAAHQYSLGWMRDFSSSVIFDPASNNRGANNAYWYAAAEGTYDRFEWSSPIRPLHSFNSTPGEEAGRYLSTAEKDQILSGAAMPLSP